MKLKRHPTVISSWFAAVLALLVSSPARAQESIAQPIPRAVYLDEVVHAFVTDKANPEVVVAGTARAVPGKRHLHLQVTGADPQIMLSGFAPAEGPLCLRFNARLTGGGMGVVYWGDEKTPGYSGERQIEFLTEYDGEWHEYTIPITTDHALTDLRMDLGSELGVHEIAELALVRGGLHPLEITAITQDAEAVVTTLHNHGNKALNVRFRDHKIKIAQKSSAELVHPLAPNLALQAIDLQFETDGFPAIARRLWLHDPAIAVPSVTLERAGLRVEVAQDGSLARVYRGEQLQTFMAPLALIDGRLPKWRVQREGATVTFTGEAKASIQFDEDDVLAIRATADSELELVVRALGSLEQAVFPGVEYLGKGERSSSKLDFSTDQSFRFMPAADHLTWPAVLLTTDRQSTALSWAGEGTRPTFASPNFVDGTADHRMALKGRTINAGLRIAPPEAISASILWTVQALGLPAVPQRPRSETEQAALCRKAFDGPLRSDKGWGHCVEAHYARHWYADHASAWWALGGDLSTLPTLVPGGGHIRDNRSLFLTKRAEMWLQMRRAEVQRTLGRMQPDGSFRYTGKYAKGHFEDTASGYCGKQALTLLTFAEQTGDVAAREAGLKVLNFMRRFRTPRGAQTWELSLHTPDILAAAHLVEAYVIGYALTGEKGYLADARKWAASGLPFVYLRGDKATDFYATIPVFGASSYVAPSWIGKPVQWNGLLYAYAIARLADHDDSFPWQQVAQGIVVAAEHMQEPDGASVGCLPDYWFRKPDRGGGPAINPTVIMSAANRAWNRPAGLQTVMHDGHRVTGPFPFEVRDGKLFVNNDSGAPHQLVIDGTRVLTGNDAPGAYEFRMSQK